MKLLPKKFKKRFENRKVIDGVPISGRKGGRVKKEQVEAKMIDRELRDYAYH